MAAWLGTIPDAVIGEPITELQASFTIATETARD